MQGVVGATAVWATISSSHSARALRLPLIVTCQAAPPKFLVSTGQYIVRVRISILVGMPLLGQIRMSISQAV